MTKVYNEFGPPFFIGLFLTNLLLPVMYGNTTAKSQSKFEAPQATSKESLSFDGRNFILYQEQHCYTIAIG